MSRPAFGNAGARPNVGNMGGGRPSFPSSLPGNLGSSRPSMGIPGAGSTRPNISTPNIQRPSLPTNRLPGSFPSTGGLSGSGSKP
ncbi:MAG: mu-protocadherin- cell-suface protein, partial [Pirellulaceae bacterium]